MPWSRSRRKRIATTETTGTVYETVGGVYTVVLDRGGEVRASLRGRLKQEEGRVVIGDRVRVAVSGDSWTIDSIEPRRTSLVRRGRGGRAPKLLAANLDRVFVVVSLGEPAAGPEVIDRLLALVEASGMHPVLVLNKLDAPGAKEAAPPLVEIYRDVGYHVLGTSAVTGEGLDGLRSELGRGSCALIGPSGVGKSTLLNALDPNVHLRTGELSAKTGRGRHTTVASRLLELVGGALVADTPGFGDVALWGVDPHHVAECFPEITEPSGRCRFRDCKHLAEPECAVRQAVTDGEIRESRYRSYVRLREDATLGRAAGGA